ncbi:MAG: DUF4178 domain-containing protein [Bryobacteraceae bacterium]|jgi:hypothetical protein
MSTAANCPNCGAPIRFRWSSAVQTVCEFCRSILVRRDVNLEKVGTVADLPEDSSPIQIATEGIFHNRPFVAIGRILYEYEQGGWNEWHVVFSDGVSGWLSDAQAQYAVSFLVPMQGLPPAESLSRGQQFRWNNGLYEVTCLTRARYRGVEGELPFEYWDKEEVLFADLETHGVGFATLDYSDPEPLLFLGEPVEFDALRLKNLRQFEGW